MWHPQLGHQCEWLEAVFCIQGMELRWYTWHRTAKEEYTKKYLNHEDSSTKWSRIKEYAGIEKESSRELKKILLLMDWHLLVQFCQTSSLPYKSLFSKPNYCTVSLSACDLTMRLFLIPEYSSILSIPLFILIALLHKPTLRSVPMWWQLDLVPTQ